MFHCDFVLCNIQVSITDITTARNFNETTRFSFLLCLKKVHSISFPSLHTPPSLRSSGFFHYDYFQHWQTSALWQPSIYKLEQFIIIEAIYIILKLSLFRFLLLSQCTSTNKHKIQTAFMPDSCIKINAINGQALIWWPMFSWRKDIDPTWFLSMESTMLPRYVYSRVVVIEGV